MSCAQETANLEGRGKLGIGNWKNQKRGNQWGECQDNQQESVTND